MCTSMTNLPATLQEIVYDCLNTEYYEDSYEYIVYCPYMVDFKQLSTKIHYNLIYTLPGTSQHEK